MFNKMITILAFLFLTQILGTFQQNITVCNSLAGFTVNANGITVCNQDGSGILRNASEVRLTGLSEFC